jgi:hypothetical protein
MSSASITLFKTLKGLDQALDNRPGWTGYSSIRRPDRQIMTHQKFPRIPYAFMERLDTASKIQLILKLTMIAIVRNSIKLMAMLRIVIMKTKGYLSYLG